MQITVIDDNKKFAEYMARLIQGWANLHSKLISIAIYESPLSVLDMNADIIFLDIEMPGMDGLTFARELYESGSAAQLVFVTSHPEYAIDGYEVGAVRYLLKDNLLPQKMYSLLDRLDSIIPLSEDKYYFLKSRLLSKRIKYDGIIYIEVIGHKIKIHTAYECYEASGSLSLIQKEFPAQFVKISRYYVINIIHVESIELGNVTLSDGTELKVSKGCLGNLLNQFEKHYKP